MSLKHQLALTFLKGIGATLSRSLLAYFGNAEDVFKVPPGRLKMVPGIGAKIVDQLNLNEALRLKPDFPEAYHSRGVAYVGKEIGRAS